MNAKIGLPPAETPPNSTHASPGEQPAGQVSANLEGHSRLQVWLHRLGVLLLVCFCATVGVLLLLLPWRQEWTDNSLLLRWPALRPIVSSGFFRGLCSGLGVLDIWIGFWEAVHYNERK